MTHEEMEDSVSGFRITGSWDDVVEHGERISAAIRRVLERKNDVEGNELTDELAALEAFEEWRPKIDDKETSISDRTAEQASVNEGALEKEEKSVKETAVEAQSDVKDAVGSAKKLDTKQTQEKINDSVVRTGQMTDSFFRRTLRWFEERVYKHIMTRISPYYFDNQLVNANFSEHSIKKYTLEVNIADDELRNNVREELNVIAEEAPRWRLETGVNPEPVEAVEGLQDVSDTTTKESVESNISSSDNERVLNGDAK